MRASTVIALSIKCSWPKTPTSRRIRMPHSRHPRMPMLSETVPTITYLKAAISNISSRPPYQTLWIMLLKTDYSIVRGSSSSMRPTSASQTSWSRTCPQAAISTSSRFSLVTSLSTRHRLWTLVEVSGLLLVNLTSPASPDGSPAEEYHKTLIEKTVSSTIDHRFSAGTTSVATQDHNRMGTSSSRRPCHKGKPCRSDRLKRLGLP